MAAAKVKIDANECFFIPGPKENGAIFYAAHRKLGESSSLFRGWAGCKFAILNQGLKRPKLVKLMALGLRWKCHASILFEQIKGKFWPPTYRRSGAHRWEKLLQPDLRRVCAGAERRKPTGSLPLRGRIRLNDLQVRTRHSAWRKSLANDLA